MTGSVGMPAYLQLQEFGSVLWSVFGSPPYQVGSSLYEKTWRDVDVRMMLSDEDYAAWGLGEPTDSHRNERWVGLVRAFSALGREMTGLPIDFQIQQQTDANARYPHERNSLGHVYYRFSDWSHRRREQPIVPPPPTEVA